jgi:hypothetical protein
MARPSKTPTRGTRGRRSASTPEPSSRQLDYFLARELFRRAHPVPALRQLAQRRPGPDASQGP